MYEPTVRVLTVFFSALLGMGLKHLLGEGAQTDAFGEDRWPAFILALLLFLRFLIGTANHMTLEFSEKGLNGSSKWFLVRHASALVLFGVLALNICYSNFLGDFLVATMWFCGAAAAFNGFDYLLERRRVFKPEGDWLPEWFVQNGIQIESAIIAWYLHRHSYFESPIPVLGYKTSLALLILVFTAICVWDFSHQLKVVEKAQNKKKLGVTNA